MTTRALLNPIRWLKWYRAGRRAKNGRFNFIPSFFGGFADLFGFHPSVGELIQSSVKLANPSESAFPSENLPFASRVIATGMWNYCFFQFYRQFVGPYWVERQYNPLDPSFIPRASSMLSINMTHRTWMGFRSVDSSSFAMVDPAGALSPVVGYYSIETGIKENGKLCLPSRGDLKVVQELYGSSPIPVTRMYGKSVNLSFTAVGAVEFPDMIVGIIEYENESDEDASIVLGIRPFNPEGAALIESMRFRPGGPARCLIEINEVPEMILFNRPMSVRFSNLENGDAYFSDVESAASKCPYGIATGMIQFPASGKGQIVFAARTYEHKSLTGPDEEQSERRLSKMFTSFVDRSGKAYGHKDKEIPDTRQILLESKRHLKSIRAEYDQTGLQQIVESPTTLPERKGAPKKNEIRGEGLMCESTILDPAGVRREIEKSAKSWKEKTKGMAHFRCGREEWNQATEILGAYLLSLQTDSIITPGIYTYRQFWFRDAAYMLTALSAYNCVDEAKKVIRTFDRYQDRDGFFRSHEGEWDSNGQALWSIYNYSEMTGDLETVDALYDSIKRGARWIVAKRRVGYRRKLMPAGFSAEHLGPADYYYWDNLWSVAGLSSAANMAGKLGKENDELHFLADEERYIKDLLDESKESRKRYGLLTAGPRRGIDPGMIGSILTLYPLNQKIFPADQVRKTVETIYEYYFHNDLFFHPIIHSGYNIYLSLQMAQSLYRLGQIDESRKILKSVLKHRTSLWTYPEAIHPQTGGGVMGDGFHGWAYAELLLLLREYAVYQEGGVLHIFRGFKKKELYEGPVHFGPFPIKGNLVEIRGDMEKSKGRINIKFRGEKNVDFTGIVIHLRGTVSSKMEHLTCRGAVGEIQNGQIVLERTGSDILVDYSFADISSSDKSTKKQVIEA